MRNYYKPDREREPATRHRSKRHSPVALQAASRTTRTFKRPHKAPRQMPQKKNHEQKPLPCACIDDEACFQLQRGGRGSLGQHFYQTMSSSFLLQLLSFRWNALIWLDEFRRQGHGGEVEDEHVFPIRDTLGVAVPTEICTSKKTELTSTKSSGINIEVDSLNKAFSTDKCRLICTSESASEHACK